MTGQLERPESWKNQKAGKTRKPEKPESRNYQKSRNERFDPSTFILTEGLFIS
jgi:hypothetical protein